jgi:hypothetical protein
LSPVTGSARADPDPHVQRRVALGITRYEFLLHRDRERHRIGDGREGQHEAVAGVLHLATFVGSELGSNQLVVFVQQQHVRIVAERLNLFDRATQVGEHDRPHRGRLVSGPRCVARYRAHELVERRRRVDLDDRRRHLAVRDPVHFLHGLLGRPFRETEHRSPRLIEPVGVVLDLVVVLHREILGVCVGEVLR